MRKRMAAFTLVEMSLVLIIMGMFIGFGLPMIRNMQQYHQRQKTFEILKAIEEALESYYVANGKLPSAIDPRSRQVSSHEKTGLVPVHALGLPESFAKDGYNYWLTYAADDRAFHEIDKTTQERPALMSIFVLKNHEGEENKKMIGILVSHGPHGRGAYNDQGKRSLDSVSAEERKNCNDDMTFYTKPYQSNVFEHHVYSVSAEKLSLSYKKYSSRSDALTEKDKPLSNGGGGKDKSLSDSGEPKDKPLLPAFHPPLASSETEGTLLSVRRDGGKEDS